MEIPAHMAFFPLPLSTTVVSLQAHSVQHPPEERHFRSSGPYIVPRLRLSIDMNMGNGPSRQCRAISRDGFRCTNSRPSGADLCSTHERQRANFNSNRDHYHRHSSSFHPPPSYHHHTASAASAAYSSYKQSQIAAIDHEIDTLRGQRASSRSLKMQELDAEIASLSASNNRRRENELRTSRRRASGLAKELSAANAQLAAERIRSGETDGLRNDLADRDTEIAALRAREIEAQRRMVESDRDVKYWQERALDYKARGRDLRDQLEDAEELVEDAEREADREAGAAMYWHGQALEYRAEGRDLLGQLEDAQDLIDDAECETRRNAGGGWVWYFRDV